jgi:hypothetical protein
MYRLLLTIAALKASSKRVAGSGTAVRQSLASVLPQLVRYLWIGPVSRSQIIPATAVLVVLSRYTIALSF